MAIPDYQSLMLPVLLASADGEVRVRDIVDRLAETLGPPHDVAINVPSTRSLLDPVICGRPLTVAGGVRALLSLDCRCYLFATLRLRAPRRHYLGHGA